VRYEIYSHHSLVHVLHRWAYLLSNQETKNKMIPGTYGDGFQSMDFRPFCLPAEQEESDMSEEKRMVDSYEIKHAIHIGDKEVLFGVDDTNTQTPYMVCSCTQDNPLGVDQYFNATGSTDYLEMMTEFISRVTTQIEAIKAERDVISVPLEPFTAEHCAPNDYRESIENKVVVIRPERLRPEYRTVNNQLVLAMGGFGSYANSRGRAVYTVNLYSGKEDRWNREDILGPIKDTCMPDWAKERLHQIQARKGLGKSIKHEQVR
jgi:hypothetical protein